MLKFWLYIIVLIAFIVLGLAIGSANESMVTFNFLFMSAELSLAMVMVVGIVVGIVIGLYIASLFCLKMWSRANGAKGEAKRAIKEAQKAIDKSKAA